MIWLGVRLSRDKASVTSWMHSGELKKRVGGDGGWAERLRGEGREGWGVQEHKWENRGGGGEQQWPRDGSTPGHCSISCPSVISLVDVAGKCVSAITTSAPAALNSAMH